MIRAVKQRILLKKNRNATAIRARYLAHRDRKLFRKRQRAALSVSAFWRGARVRLARKRELLRKKNAAATAIQVHLAPGRPSTTCCGVW